jgi:hypothetical protein
LISICTLGAMIGQLSAGAHPKYPLTR